MSLLLLRPLGFRSAIRRAGPAACAATAMFAAACGSSNANLVHTMAMPDAGGPLDASVAYASSSDAGSSDASSPLDASSAEGSANGSASPGAVFDLSLWELQEPVGSIGNPTTISASMLEGATGYHDAYFFLDAAGAMTFWDPENGVTTADSSYPRSELREMNADGTTANWPIAGTNTLTATVAVTEVPDHVCIGQIHIGSALDAGLASSTKPLLELYYYQGGTIEVGIENSPTGGQTQSMLGNVALGTQFTYSIVLTGAGAIAVAINGQSSAFTMPPAFAGYGEYFKAGDYDQTVGTDATVGATVKFYALAVSHMP